MQVSVAYSTAGKATDGYAPRFLPTSGTGYAKAFVGQKRGLVMLNRAEPTILHIDLNSCFAIIEQQSNRLLRGRPVGVAAYDSPRGFVLAASYEAKAKGIKLGVNCQQARVMCPGITILTPDPSKYREAHKRFKHIMLQYSDKVVAKSIDEFVLDLSGSPAQRAGLSPEQVGQEIKQRVAQDLGEAVTVNVGIGTNRFLAKYAAGFDKPDGMTTINDGNLEHFYEGQDLIDLPGINVRYRRRLRASGITNPLEFYRADERTLHKIVFKSVVGKYWYQRLRGWEVDDRVFTQKTIGHQYALKQKTTDLRELEKLLIKLCEKVGRRLRRGDYYANGIHLYLGFSTNQPATSKGKKTRVSDHAAFMYSPPSTHNLHRAGEVKDPKGTAPLGFETNNHTPLGFGTDQYLRSWHQGRKLDTRLYSSRDIFLAAKQLLRSAPIPSDVRIMSVNVYGLNPWDPEQINMFEAERNLSSGKNLSDAMDAINNRYGNYAITPASMADMQGTILDRIAFGNTPD